MPDGATTMLDGAIITTAQATTSSTGAGAMPCGAIVIPAQATTSSTGATATPGGTIIIPAQATTCSTGASTMLGGTRISLTRAATMPARVTTDTRSGTATLRAKATISGIGAATMPARSKTGSTGWLWRKMSKIGTSAKRRWRGSFKSMSCSMRDLHVAKGSNGEALVDVFQNFGYYVLWVLEGVVVVVGFCVFFLRFGGRL